MYEQRYYATNNLPDLIGNSSWLPNKLALAWNFKKIQQKSLLHTDFPIFIQFASYLNKIYLYLCMRGSGKLKCNCIGVLQLLNRWLCGLHCTSSTWISCLRIF